jgi:hypothetical protein
MKKTTKAVLLSALAFPGAGHLYLKHKKRGVLLLALFFVLFYHVINSAYRQAQFIYEEILAGHVALTQQAIIEFMADNAFDMQQLQQAGYASNALLILWLIGMLDSYRLAKIQINS